MSKVVAHPEPVATEIDFANESYTIKLVSALNWYNTEKDKKDARKYVEDYAKRTGVRLGDYTDSDIVLTMGWLARLANKGATLSVDHVHHLNRYMARLSALKKLPVQAPVQRVSIQEATQNRISSYLGELEGVFDEIAKNPKQEFSLLADLKKNQLPQAAASDVGNWTKSKVRELVAAYEGKDKDLAEGYSNFNKRDLMAVIKRLASFLEDAEKYSAFKKANRKPREKKVKPPTQQVKTLKYKPRDEDLQITSIPPTNIVGAQQVWLFNTKTRKLSVYRTDSALGIQVKGTTLQNYEPDISCQKTLRKPAEQIKELMAAGKVQLRKFMDSIKAVEMPCNGRLNEDTLILRAMK